MHTERGGFERGIGFGEIHPSQSIGEKFNPGEVKSDIKELSEGKGVLSNSTDAGFEKIANAVANKERIMSGREFRRDAVIFQQGKIKEILAIENDDPRKALEDAKKCWIKYDDDAIKYAQRFEDIKIQQAIISEFERYKVAIQGSLLVIRFLEEKGFEVKFPSPDDDVAKQCDLIFEKTSKKEKDYNLAVQLKSYKTSAKDRKETKKDSEKMFSTDYYDLGDKEQQESFAKLRSHCLNMSRKTGKNYFPVFMNIPVSIDARNPKKGEPTKYPLVDERGFLKSGQLGDTMNILWKECDRLLTKRNK